MEGTKPRTANSLGMFDFLKGIGMLTIVFAHSAELYPVGATTTITPMTFYLFAYRHSNRASGRFNFHTATKSVSTIHCDSSNCILTNVLGNLYNKCSAVCPSYLKRFVYAW